MFFDELLQDQWLAVVLEKIPGHCGACGTSGYLA